MFNDFLDRRPEVLRSLLLEVIHRLRVRVRHQLEFGGHVSLIVFLALYFLFLWIAWLLAVWLTKPKDAEPQSARSA